MAQGATQCGFFLSLYRKQASVKVKIPIRSWRHSEQPQSAAEKQLYHEIVRIPKYVLQYF